MLSSYKEIKGDSRLKAAEIEDNSSLCIAQFNIICYCPLSPSIFLYLPLTP